MTDDNRFFPDEDEGVDIPVDFEDDEVTEEASSSASEEAVENEDVRDEERVESVESDEAGEPEEEAEPEEPENGDEPESGEPEENSPESAQAAGDEDAEDFSEAGQEPSDAEAAPGEEAGDAAEDAAGAGEDGKKGLFGFRKKDKEKEKLQEHVKELNDRLLRSMAEFDNFRKRSEKEKGSMYAMGAEDIIKKILPVVDSFERGLAQTENTENPFAEGMKMIYKQMMTALEEAGVAPIEAVGNKFDPNLHNAVMHVEDEELGENVVAEEFQKGYTYKGNVVRHSMVKVAN